MVNWAYEELVLAADFVSRNGWIGVRAALPEALRGQAHARRTAGS